MLLFLSCMSDNTLVVEKEVLSEINPPEIFITPNPINFNHLDALDEDTMSVYISNLGDEDLNISAIIFEGDENFELRETEDYIIPKGEQEEFFIDFRPLEYDHYIGEITVISNNFEDDITKVPVEGYGDAAKIKVDPEEYDFNSTSIPCFEEKEITISNVGNKDLEINNASISATVPQDFDIDYNWNLNGNFDWILSPNDSLTVIVEYNPKDLIQDNLYLEIDSNDPMYPLKTNVYTGNGYIGKEMSETFKVSDTRVADMLFVIDNSGSMFPFQNSLAGHFTDFLNILLNFLNIDYKIGVITTDDPSFVGNIIDLNTPDPVSEFVSIINAASTYGSGYEIGLQMAYEATLNGDASISSGFIRNGAFLSIVFLSDEPDHSHQTNVFYYNHFLTLKTDPNKVKVHSIIGDYPSGCQYNNRMVQFGDGYYDLTSLTGGNSYSICAVDWGIQMQSLASNSSGANIFGLFEDPIEETIEVYVDGQITNQWSYNSTLNSVSFDQGYLPDPDQEVRVDYGVLSECQ